MEDRKKENRSYHRPAWNDHGQFHFQLICHPKEEDARATAPVDRSRSVYSDLSDALVFTARSIIKIAQQVPAP